jgi:hypothetical protein
MTVRIIIVATASVVLVATSSAQTPASDSTLSAANKLYNAGSYESAELAARRRMELGPIAAPIRIEAERIIAFSLVAQGKPDLAREHFEIILSVDPSFGLDPVLTSPKILTVFQEAKIHAAAVRRQGSIDASPNEGERSGVSFRAVLFPGWEQLHQGRSDVGLVFAGAGVLTLGSAITFEILRGSARKDYLAATQPGDIASKYNRYNRYYRGEVYSFIAFAGVYIASEFDIFLNSDRSVDIRATSAASGGPGLIFSLRW